VCESLAAHFGGREARQDHGDTEAAQPEQIARKLMAADRLLAEGKDTVAVRRELGVSEAFVPLNLAGSQTRQVAVLIMVFPQQVRASGSGQSGRAGLVTVTSHPHWVSGQW
jgi:hypothetical protein